MDLVVVVVVVVGGLGILGGGKGEIKVEEGLLREGPFWWRRTMSSSSILRF